MLKKVLIGSVIVLALGVLVVGAFVALSLYQIQAVVDDVEEVEDAFRETNRRFPYEGLTTETLTEQRFRDFLATRREVAASLDKYVTELKSALQREEDRAKAGTRRGTLALMRLLRSHFALLSEVPMLQVEALVARGMSAHEYRELTRAIVQTTRAGDSPAAAAAWKTYEAAAREYASLIIKPRRPQAAAKDNEVPILPANAPLLEDEVRSRVEELLGEAVGIVFDADTAFLDVIVLQFDATTLLESDR